MNVVASEKTLGVTNSKAVFILDAIPQLKLKSRPDELDAENKLKVTGVHQLPVPIYHSDNLIRYTIVEKDEDLAPDWITIKNPRSSPPYIEVKCTHVPIKHVYEFELTASDYK